MKDLYEWLQSEVIEAQDLLENEIIQMMQMKLFFLLRKSF